MQQSSQLPADIERHHLQSSDAVACVLFGRYFVSLETRELNLAYMPILCVEWQSSAMSSET